MSAYAEHAAGITELMDELGEDCPTIIYGGSTVRVLPSAARNASKNGIGGLALEADLQFTAILADFPSTPVSNKSFTYGGKSYKIADVTFLPGRLQVHITANDAAQSL